MVHTAGGETHKVRRSNRVIRMVHQTLKHGRREVLIASRAGRLGSSHPGNRPAVLANQLLGNCLVSRVLEPAHSA
jgi:hypothetical protein